MHHDTLFFHLSTIIFQEPFIFTIVTIDFQRDDNKARINSEKHGVTFQEAKTVQKPFSMTNLLINFLIKKILTKRIAFFSLEGVFTPEF